MDAVETPFKSAHRHLDVFEESWKSAHVNAMKYYDFETFLAEGAMVFRGIEELSPQLDEAEKEFYTHWLVLADAVAQVLAAFEKEYRDVKGADEFRKCQELARERLAKWVPAVPTRTVGFRVWDVSVEEADELRDLMNAPPDGPGRPKWQPKELPDGDPSMLR